jgi:nucleotide-binding universal stress UspA family protein
VVPVTIEAATGAPGPVLLDAARGADLLVLGHRGRGVMRSALLGSVGLHCVFHASCPVTIVRKAPLAGQVPTTEAAVAAAQA